MARWIGNTERGHYWISWAPFDCTASVLKMRNDDLEETEILRILITDSRQVIKKFSELLHLER